MPPSIGKWIDHTNKLHVKEFQQLIEARKIYRKSQREQRLTSAHAPPVPHSDKVISIKLFY